MTVEPASTRANRINSDSLDRSYRLGIRRARGVRGGGDPRLIHRLPRPDGRRWPALRQPGRVHLRGPRRRLRVDVLPDVRQLAVPDGNGEDEMILERPVRGFDFPRSETDD